EPEEEEQESLASWISANLLTRYKIREASEQHPVPATVSITRQVCASLDGSAPKSPEHPVACDKHDLSWENNEAEASAIHLLMEKSEFEAAFSKIADASKFILNDGDQSWRFGDPRGAASHALYAQAQKWGVIPDAALPVACSDVSLEEPGNHLMDCES